MTSTEADAYGNDCFTLMMEKAGVLPQVIPRHFRIKKKLCFNKWAKAGLPLAIAAAFENAKDPAGYGRNLMFETFVPSILTQGESFVIFSPKYVMFSNVKFLTSCVASKPFK